MVLIKAFRGITYNKDKVNLKISDVDSAPKVSSNTYNQLIKRTVGCLWKHITENKDIEKENFLRGITSNTDNTKYPYPENIKKYLDSNPHLAIKRSLNEKERKTTNTTKKPSSKISKR